MEDDLLGQPNLSPDLQHRSGNTEPCHQPLFQREQSLEHTHLSDPDERAIIQDTINQSLDDIPLSELPPDALESQLAFEQERYYRKGRTSTYNAIRTLLLELDN